MIAKSMYELSKKTDARARLDLMPTLIGRVSEAAVVDASWVAQKDAVVRLGREARLQAILTATP